MIRPALAMLAVTMLLGGCGALRDSGGWFDRSREVTLVPSGGFPELVDNRRAVREVTALTVAPVSGGALVQAVGLPPTQGWWDAELLPEAEMRAVDGTLTFRFVVASPRGPRPAGTPMSREVSAGIFVPESRLMGAGRITVLGEENARSATRR